MDPVIEPVVLMSPGLAGGFFTTSATWKTLLSGIFSYTCISIPATNVINDY